MYDFFLWNFTYENVWNFHTYENLYISYVWKGYDHSMISYVWSYPFIFVRVTIVYLHFLTHLHWNLHEYTKYVFLQHQATARAGKQTKGSSQSSKAQVLEVKEKSKNEAQKRMREEAKTAEKLAEKKRRLAKEILEEASRLMEEASTMSASSIRKLKSKKW